MDKTQPMADTQQRSTFVNVLAWIFIVMAGFGTFISILQNIMIYKMFPRDEMKKALQQPEASNQIPVFAQFMFLHIELFFLLALIVVATTFISAIGLLKRKNWARIFFMVMMSLGIVWNIFSVFMGYMTFSNLPANAATPQEFESMMVIMKVATLIMAILFSVLFGWIIKKLNSTNIKTEFA